MVPNFQNMIGWVPMTQGFNPYFILGSHFFSLAVINLFDITKCSKLLNRIGNTGKTCKSYTVVGALAYMFVLPQKPQGLTKSYFCVFSTIMVL